MKTRYVFPVFLLTLLIFSLVIQPVFAVNNKIDVPTVLENQFVYDQGNFLEKNTLDKTNRLLVELENKTKIEFAVITIKSLNNMEITQYANKLANTLGIGKKDQNNGILLLISKSDNKVRLEIGDGLQGILTDSISGRILDTYFVPHREKRRL